METSSHNKEKIQAKPRPRIGLSFYAELLDEYRELSREASELNTSQRSKLSLRKLLVTKRFARIDEELLSLSKDRKSTNIGEFFSDILLFEAKRLAFKEEALKCQQTKNQTQV